MDVKTAVAVRVLDNQLIQQVQSAPAIPISPERARETLARGVPLVSLAGPAIDPHRYGEVMREYRRLLVRFHPALGGELERAEQVAVAAGPALIFALIEGDAGTVYDLARAGGAAPEQVLFLGELALRPFMVAYAWAVSGTVDLGAHRSVRCPICGCPAHMGQIDPDNVKHLHCPLCETTWRGPRVGCVYCGSTDPHQVGYFTVEGNEEHRVETCAQCGNYLKVIDQRVRVRPIDWLVEDTATQFLDELAAAEGLVRNAQPVVS